MPAGAARDRLHRAINGYLGLRGLVTLTALVQSNRIDYFSLALLISARAKMGRDLFLTARARGSTR